MKPTDSGTSGSPSQDQGVSSSTGPQRGGTGVATVAESRQFLIGKKPEEVDQAILALLTSRHDVRVKESAEWRFPPDKPPYQVVTSVGLAGLSKDNHASVIDNLRAALTPPTFEQAEKLVAQLATLPRRNMSGDTAETAFHVYVRRLLDHPADVAFEVIRMLIEEPPKPGETTWLPSPPELESMLRSRSSRRKAMLEDASNWQDYERTPPDEEQDRLYHAWGAAEAKVKHLDRKVGPGPVTDTGPRGERIAAWEAAKVECYAAKDAYNDYVHAKNASD